MLVVKDSEVRFRRQRNLVCRVHLANGFVALRR